MKNITLSADEGLIEAALRRAAEEGTTLNAQFRLWLSDYVGRGRQADTALETIRELRREIATGGRKFTRDEMNERSHRRTEEEDAPVFASRWRGQFQPAERDDALAKKYFQ